MIPQTLAAVASLGALASLAPLLLADPATTRPAAQSVLTVDVADLRNARGVLRVGVFTKAEGFPSDPRGAILWSSIPAGAEARSVAIELPAGEYAVLVLHDENSNRRLDTNFLGVPREGYGVTNNPKPRMRSATFKEARFTLPADGARMTVSLQYF
jgi:uncharacterized protein (DUF2141 family)